MFDIQWHRAATEMLLDQNKNRGRKGKKDELELTEIFSVLFCSWYLLSEFTYSYGNIQNKMWNTVSYLWSMGSLFQKLICRQVSSVARWIAIYQAFSIYSRRPLVNIYFAFVSKVLIFFYITNDGIILTILSEKLNHYPAAEWILPLKDVKRRV